MSLQRLAGPRQKKFNPDNHVECLGKGKAVWYSVGVGRGMGSRDEERRVTGGTANECKGVGAENMRQK